MNAMRARTTARSTFITPSSLRIFDQNVPLFEGSLSSSSESTTHAINAYPKAQLPSVASERRVYSSFVMWSS